MNWFKRLFRTKVVMINRDRYQLTLDEWRADSKLVLLAQRELARAEIKVMLDVIRNAHPCNRVYAEDCNPNIRVVAQSQSEGYTMALANFEALGKFKQLEEPIEPTFEPEELEKK